MNLPRSPLLLKAVSYMSQEQLQLSEPLLVDKTTTIEKDDSLSTGQTRWLHVQSFLTGAWMAVLSQFLLSQVMTMQNLVESSTWHICVFSLTWSFWTCVVVFVSMLAWGRLIVNRVRRGCVDDSLLFQMEAHHIVGALLSISVLWMVVDVFQASSTWWIFLGNMSNNSAANMSNDWMATLLALGNQYQSALISLAGMILWYPLMACLLPRAAGRRSKVKTKENNNGLTSTYHLIAVALGLITGLCSQFLLSFCFWRQTWMDSSLEQIVLFSMLWSFTTVLWTAAGCASLRLVLVNHHQGEDAAVAERMLFQMESRYIIGSLIGICAAWMVMDWVFHVREQILPCLLLLSLSLACFFLILLCFPEDECFPCNTTDAVERRRGSDDSNPIIIHLHPTMRQEDEEEMLVCYA